MRRQVIEESIKNVVLSADSAKLAQPTDGISTELGLKTIEKPTMVKTKSPAIAHSAKSGEKFVQDCVEIVPSTSSLLSPSLEEYLNQSQAFSSPSSQRVTKETSEIMASLPPPPMQYVKNDLTASAFAPDNELPSPPPSPLLSPLQSHSAVAKPRAHHITSRSGTDLFHITISKLKTSFTTKIAADESCKFEVDRFFPSILLEKGRLNVDDFNKFIYEKTKSGKWNLVHLKLSSIEGNSNMNSYKKFYKEYEALGRLTMIQVSDTTKMFLVTPKFLRVCKCLSGVENLSKSSTYVVVLTKDKLIEKSY